MPISLPKHINYTQEHRQVRGISDEKQIIAISVEVATGNVEYGGTDANVYLEIGAHPFLLDKANHDDHEKGDRESYYFPTDMTFGDLKRSRIVLRHDNSGANPGWNVAQTVLQVRFRDSHWMRTYKRWGASGWLAKDEDPYRSTYVELQLGEEL